MEEIYERQNVLVILLKFYFMNFLIVEDDVFLASKLKYLFDKRRDTNLVKVVNNYVDFLDELSIIDIYDIILLDINL